MAPTKVNVYEIGSVTKLFTSLLLAHAVHEGRIGLQDDIRRYLPGTYSNLAFGESPVRVIDLADTTSALPDNLPNFQEVTANAPEEQKASVLAKALNEYSQENMLSDLHSISLAGKPGIETRHSNLAAELLGYILTRIYGQPFRTLLVTKIQEPLGMQNGVTAENPKLLVKGYDAHHTAMPATDQPAVLAAGGLRFSTQDMAKFLQAELVDGDPSIQLTQRAAFGRVETGAIGFNWQITRNVEGALKLNASGGTSGGASYVEIYPERGYGLVLLANRSGETEGLLYGLADSLFAATEGTPGLNALKRTLESTRYAHIESTVLHVKQQFPHLNLSEAYVNNWGGGLLGSNPKAALALFQFNTQQWPNSSDAFDSLGDGYVQNGNKSNAAKAYRRALELNPTNKEASDSLSSVTKN
jgi:D-alanyl-D-alanine-carboxypeptidase/D-alanyl-D-alanine-endopeptidase